MVGIEIAAYYFVLFLVGTGRVGTAHFMSPEMVERVPYGSAVDVWSAGALLYVLLCGQLPFTGTRDKLFDAIIAGAFDVCVLPQVFQITN